MRKNSTGFLLLLGSLLIQESIAAIPDAVIVQSTRSQAKIAKEALLNTRRENLHETKTGLFHTAMMEKARRRRDVQSL